MKALSTLAAALFVFAAAQTQAQGWAEEQRDWGVAPSSALRRAPYSAPTPTTIPGARTVRTAELGELTRRSDAPLLVDVASGEGHTTLAGALWWPGAGRGSSFIDLVQGEIATRLQQLSGGRKDRPIAFFCVNSRCWLSYNAGLRAVALGYTRVLWYRGGVEAWRAAGLPLGRAREPWTGAGALPAER